MRRQAPTPRPAQARPPADGILPRQERILSVVAELTERGIPVNRDSVARWLDIHPNGGRYNTDLGALRAAGHLDGFRLKTSTPAFCLHRGIDGAVSVISKHDDKTAQRIFEALISISAPVTRDELATHLGIHPNGGRFNTGLGRLRTMGLITERGPIEITPGARR